MFFISTIHGMWLLFLIKHWTKESGLKLQHLFLLNMVFSSVVQTTNAWCCLYNFVKDLIFCRKSFQARLSSQFCIFRSHKQVTGWSCYFEIPTRNWCERAHFLFWGMIMLQSGLNFWGCFLQYSHRREWKQILGPMFLVHFHAFYINSSYYSAFPLPLPSPCRMRCCRQIIK